MLRLLKLSFVSLKNILISKPFIFSILGSFIYSAIWILFIHPENYNISDYSFEFSKILYLVIIYTSASILRNDIIFNTTKIVFTGIFSRIAIMFSKLIELIILGIFFSIIAEINNLLISIFLYFKNRNFQFFDINYIDTFLIYTVITFSIGSLTILIISIAFNGKKGVLELLLMLGILNFANAGIVNIIHRNINTPTFLLAYKNTFIYSFTNLFMYGYNVKDILVALIFGMIFFSVSLYIMNRRDIV